MQLKLNHFNYFPGGDDEPVASNPSDDAGKSGKEDAPKEEKGFFQKIKNALQDWSNQDQKDQEFDDTRV